MKTLLTAQAHAHPPAPDPSTINGMKAWMAGQTIANRYMASHGVESNVTGHETSVCTNLFKTDPAYPILRKRLDDSQATDAAMMQGCTATLVKWEGVP